MKLLPFLALSCSLPGAVLAQQKAPAKAEDPLGYTDTPIIPGTKWHVHDSGRPQPVVVTPGTPSTPEKAGTAPSDAVVLFNGTDLSKWTTAKKGGPSGEATWKVENGYVEANKTGDLITKDDFGPDFQLHVEWASPNPPEGVSQHRGNSGIFLMGRYECQVLDNYNNQTYPDGQATAIYGYMPPQVNACKPPGEWQTYDILWQAPRFKDNKLVSPAYITTIHNGVVTQNHTALIGETPHKKVGTYTPHPEKGPLKLQDHGNPVRYRNIWIREMHMPTPEDIGDGPAIGK